MALLIFVIGAPFVFSPRSPRRDATPTGATAPAVIERGSAAAPQEGGIDVTVAHDSASSSTTHAFTLTLNTHSGDLSAYDAQANVAYRTSSGSEAAPASVGGDRETHHRTITVTYDNVTLPGNVVVKNLRGVPERLFPVIK